MNKKTTEQREDFIVQNVTPGYHYISDLKLNIGPLEVVDLTHKDPDDIRGSQNLKDSLRAGFLRRITREEADKSAARRTAQMRKEVTKLQRGVSTEQMNVEGKTLDVEPLNITRTESSKYVDQVTTAGYANDPMSYTIALEIAQQQAAARGEDLTVEDFRDMVTRDAELVRRLITANTNAVRPLAYDEGVDSGAYFAQPTEKGGSVIGRQRMKAPETMAGDTTGNAEVIDLTDKE